MHSIYQYNPIKQMKISYVNNWFTDSNEIYHSLIEGHLYKYTEINLGIIARSQFYVTLHFFWYYQHEKLINQLIKVIFQLSIIQII